MHKKYLSRETEKVRGNVKTKREIRNFIRWRTEVEDTKRNATQNAHDNFEKKAIFEVFFIWNNFECISSFAFLHREHRHDFAVWKKKNCFKILKKSSVFPRTIWRPSNLIVQFKWDTNLFKNMKKFGYWEDRAALLTYMSSTLSSDVVFLVRFPQDLRSWTWLQKVTGCPSLGKKWIVRSRQVIERADDIIVTVVKDVRIESISTSMIQDLWFSALRCTRNHYLLSSFLKESVFLTRQCTVNFTNPNDMRPESQNAIIKKRIFSTTILIKDVEVCKWRSLYILSAFYICNTDENIRFEKMWFARIDFAKFRIDELLIWIIFSKISETDQENEIHKLLLPDVIPHKNI